MKFFLLATLITFGALAQSTDNFQTCDMQGNCTDTGTPITGSKNAGTAAASSMQNLFNTSNFGQMSGSSIKCDAEGHCVTDGTFNINSESLFGDNQNDASGTPTDGISGTITAQNTIQVSCAYHKSYTLGSGVTIRIEGCHLDPDNNVTQLEARACYANLREDGCDEDEPSIWSPNALFTSSSLPYVTNATRPLDSSTTVTINCHAQNRVCDMDVTTEIELSGNMEELGQQAYDGTNDPNNYLSGQQMANRFLDSPAFQAQVDGVGDDMINCAQDNLFGYQDDGYLLSCDGQTQVDMAATCEEVITCVEEETTVITNRRVCESTVPTTTQYCDVSTPTASCEVFLEAHEQICDTYSENGTCVSELENAIKVCNTHIPDGNCSVEMETVDVACEFSIPTGSCAVELISDTNTCRTTIPRGECSGTVDTFVKTCSETNEIVNCFIETEISESECIATPQYDTRRCEHTRDVTENECHKTIEPVVQPGEGGECVLHDGVVFEQHHGWEQNGSGGYLDIPVDSRGDIGFYTLANIRTQCRDTRGSNKDALTASRSCSPNAGEARIALWDDWSDQCDEDDRAHESGTQVGSVIDFSITRESTGYIREKDFDLNWETTINGDELQFHIYSTNSLEIDGETYSVDRTIYWDLTQDYSAGSPGGITFIETNECEAYE